MSVPYSFADHGKIEWPLPWPGVWLRSEDRPDELAFWRLDEGELYPTHVRKDATVAPSDTFAMGGRECVWLDVAEPAGQQRLFAIGEGATMTGLDHYRSKP